MINFSVIIPNYNHAEFLKERIDSVLNQTIPPYEVILLDDGSSDKSKQILESYSAHPLVSHIILAERNGGSPFIQWAKGIRIATSSWVWIAESDDAADPGFLSAAQDAITNNPETGLFYSDSLLMGNSKTSYNSYAEAKNKFFNTRKWSADYFKPGREDINESMKWVCTVNNSSAAVFRKDLVEEILDKLETFIYHGDWYCELAVAAKSNVSYSAMPLNHFRMHPQSFLRRPNKLQSKLECFRVLEHLYEEDYVTNKEKLIEFFTLQYLGYGFLTDGFRFGKNLFRSYAQINEPLAKKVWKTLLLQKFTGKRRRNIF